MAWEVAETEWWRRTPATVETDWINEMKVKGVDGAQPGGEARALTDKHAP